jgi:uncharacterized protein YkwD
MRPIFQPMRVKAMATAFATLVLLTLALAPSASASTITSKNKLERRAVARINAIRASHGLRRLRVSSLLSQAAERHVKSMGNRGYFRHELYTPRLATDWTPFDKWIRWFWPGPGYSSWTAGENIVWGAPDLNYRQAVRRWMHSSEHRANILERGWTRIALAAVQVEDPRGYYKSWDTVTIVTAEFGRRG